MTTFRGDIFLRSLLVWLVIIAAETIHGIVRVVLLVPQVGDLRARQIGVPIGSVIIFVIAWLTIRWIGARGQRELLTTGAIWVVLTINFEVVLGGALGYSWDRVFSDYDIRAGGFMIAGLLFMFFAPYLAARTNKIS
jgi:hypothetical protein